MKTSVVRKKVKHIKELIGEYEELSSLVHYMKIVKIEGTPEAFLNNIEKRMKKIEEVFDHLLK